MTARVRRHVIALTVLAAATLAAGASALARAEARWREFPTHRDPTTWTEADVTRIFDEPGWHWCDYYHGHQGGWMSSYTCKGKRRRAILGLARVPRVPGVRERVASTIAAPLGRVAAAGAHVAGSARFVELSPVLRARAEWALDVRARKAPADSLYDDDQDETLAACSWALEQLGAREALPVLERDLERATVWQAHAVAVLGSRVACAGCQGPIGR